MFRNLHFFERAGSGEEPGTNFGSFCGHEAGRKRATGKFGRKLRKACMLPVGTKRGGSGLPENKAKVEKGMYVASGHQAGRKRTAKKLGKS